MASRLEHLVSTFFAEPYLRPIPLGPKSFIQYFLPPILGYHALAFLVCLPGTRFIRFAIALPVVFLAYRAAALLDLAHGFQDERMAYINQGLLLAMTALSMQVISWATSTEHYQRIRPADKTSSAPKPAQSQSDIWRDAFHLVYGARGIGWNWSKGLHIPAHTRPLSSRALFVLYTVISLLAHLIAKDVIHYYIQTFTRFNLACPRGASIFVEELPPIERYALSTYISLLAGPVVYCAIQCAYDVATLIGTGIFQQDPRDWPPIFDEPWKATSLRNFWAKGWHQVFRHSFVTLGAVPFSKVLGRVGAPLGAFLISGILHYLGLWGMARGSDWRMIGFFLMMSAGIILEDLWKRLTGRKVRGFYGWLWTMLWVIGWANILVDAWARKGLIASTFYPENYRPAELIFGPLKSKVDGVC
ncbi:hypothetical protein Moror_1216 [Moniliophthora roreri MCA 2997]|uniref:Wax synthase domain-containing protein n=1 Tax=Moniliophthora roreri (strain MCA 2997) TaxID=1381753 RepID=V2WR09_MONRO|nr:hypothetical protein Moror_1216 [Moniliophthora roreri MCA 2997]